MTSLDISSVLGLNKALNKHMYVNSLGQSCYISVIYTTNLSPTMNTEMLQSPSHSSWLGYRGMARGLLQDKTLRIINTHNMMNYISCHNTTCMLSMWHTTKWYWCVIWKWCSSCVYNYDFYVGRIDYSPRSMHVAVFHYCLVHMMNLIKCSTHIPSKTVIITKWNRT